MKSAPPHSFAPRVYAIVRRIPRGRIATYGQVAALSGYPGAARAVGTALARLPTHLQALVPWQRVVSSAGVSRQRSPEDASTQRELLRSEGIAVQTSGKIDMRRHQWSGSMTQRRGIARRKRRRRSSEPFEM